MEKRQKFASSVASSQSGLSALSSSSADANWADLNLDQEKNPDFLEAFKDLSKDAETTFEFLVGVNEIVCATVLVNIFLVCITLFCVVEAYFGLKNLTECPENPKIPMFLFVGGCFGTLKAIHTLYINKKISKHNQNNTASYRADNIVDIALNIFLLAWQGMGTYWTFSVWYPPETEPLTDDPVQWCNGGAYFFAVIQTGVAGVLIIIMFLMHCVFAFWFKFCNCAT